MKIDLFAKCSGLDGNFSILNNQSDHYLIEPHLDSPVGPKMSFHGKKKIMWSVNNYLGLAGNSLITNSAQSALQEWGISSPMGSRLMTGDTPYHQELEQHLAEFCDKSGALLTSFGYLGILGVIPGLVGRGDVVLIDSLSHASIVDAAILAQAKSGMRFRPFKHNDMDDLESQLALVSEEGKGGALIVTEGVFGMHGDLGALPEICKLKSQYGARLFVDDAHGIGVMGPNGHGTGEFYGVQDEIDIYYGTFTKAFSILGGVAAGPKEVMSYLKFNSRTSIFSRSLPLVIVQAIAASLSLVKNQPENRKKLWKITTLLQNGLRELGFNIGNTQSPITPIQIPNDDFNTAANIVRTLREQHDIFVTAVTYPVIPKGRMIFRLIPTATHTEEDVALTLKAFAKIRDELNLQL